MSNTGSYLRRDSRKEINILLQLERGDIRPNIDLLMLHTYRSTKRAHNNIYRRLQEPTSDWLALVVPDRCGEWWCGLLELCVLEVVEVGIRSVLDVGFIFNSYWEDWLGEEGVVEWVLWCGYLLDCQGMVLARSENVLLLLNLCYDLMWRILTICRQNLLCLVIYKNTIYWFVSNNYFLPDVCR